MRVGLLTLKYGGRAGTTRTLLRKIAYAAWALGRDDFIIAMRYIVYAENPITDALLREVIAELQPHHVEPIMSLALEGYKKQWIAEGLESGLARGLREGLEKGLSQGLEKGLSQGLEKGLSQGRAAGLAEALIKQATRRFGTLAPATRAHIAAATPEQLDLWLDQIWDAPNLEALLAPPAATE